MSTTLTAAYRAGDELFVVHVGHSRAYLYRGGLLTRLTGAGQPLAPQCQTLLDLALERGGPDNITAVLARYRIP